MAVFWELLFRPETGLVALAMLSGGAVSWIVKALLQRAETAKHRAEIDKYRAEIEKIIADERRAVREDVRSRNERTTACAADVLNSTSMLLNQLNAVFFPFAFPAATLSKAKRREFITGAKRFRHEQLYRPIIEKLIAELVALGGFVHDLNIDQLRVAVDALLLKISEKKSHVSKLEDAEQATSSAEDLKAWLGECLEIQVLIGSLVGTITGRLAAQEYPAQSRAA